MPGILMKHERRPDVCARVSAVHPLLTNRGKCTNEMKEGVENLIKMQQSLYLIKSPFDAQISSLNNSLSL